MSSDSYQQVYDLCCDHGRLGLHVYQHSDAEVFLVDQVPSIISDLRRKHKHLQDDRLKFVCQSAGQISLESNKKQLLVLAGIGGQLAKSLIEQLLRQIQQQDDHRQVEWLIAAQFHMHELRGFLRQQQFELLQEQYCYDNGKHYELLFVRSGGSGYLRRPVSETGQQIWQSEHKKVQEYYQYLCRHYHLKWHYQQCQTSRDILQQYEKLSI